MREKSLINEQKTMRESVVAFLRSLQSCWIFYLFYMSSLIDGNVLFCFLNFLSLLNLASTLDREIKLSDQIEFVRQTHVNIYLVTQDFHLLKRRNTSQFLKYSQESNLQIPDWLMGNVFSNFFSLCLTFCKIVFTSKVLAFDLQLIQLPIINWSLINNN